MKEKVILRFHPTRFWYIKRYFLGAVFMLAGLALYFDLATTFGMALAFPKIYLLLLGLIGVLLFASAELSRIFYTYIVTDQRVIERRGIFSRAEDSIDWDKISSTSLKQSLVERLLNIGCLEFWAVGGVEEPEVVMKYIPGIRKKKAIIDSLIKKRETISEIVMAKPLEEVRPKEIGPAIDIGEALALASKYLEKNNIHISSLRGGKFFTDRGLWQFLLDTDDGYYVVGVSNERKVVEMSKLSFKEMQEKFRHEYLMEKLE